MSKYKDKIIAEAKEKVMKQAPPIPDNVKHLFDKDKNFKDKLSKFKFIKMVKLGQVKGVTPSMVDDMTELTEFTSAQMTKLKKEYEPLKGKRLPVGAIDKMNIMLKKYSTDMLMKLAKGGIAFLSTAAKSELVINRGKKWSDFKEPLDMAEADELQCEACWTGFKQVGMKTKGGKQVPNCVPEEKLFEDPDCPTCNGGECQCATPEVGKVHECCGGEECICDSLEEALKVKYDKTKQGWFDDKGRRRYLGNAATNAIMKKKLDHAIKTGDWTSFDVNVNEIIEAHQGKGLPPHLAKLFDKDGNFKDPKTQKKYQDMIDRQGKTRLSKVTDVTPKGYGPKEELDHLEENKITKAKEIAKKMAGNMTGAVKEIEKMVKGLSKHPDVAAALRMANEDLNKDDEKVVKKVRDMLKGASAKHASQAKMIDKALKSEADLNKQQIKMVHKKADDLPKSDFVKRYGKDGDSVRFATATNIVKKKLGIAENLIKGENKMNESYKDNFNAAMEELGINSLDELESVEEQKAFFSYVDSLEEGLTAGQKKLPPALQKAILKKQGEKKDDKKDEEVSEATSPAQQAAIAISKKEKEMSKEMKELKAETDPEKMEMMKKEMMKKVKKEMADMDEMSEMMKKEMMKEMKKKMDEYGSMNINAMKEMAEMKPMNAMKMNAMTDPKKMNAMTMQDPKQDMLKKHSNDDIKAMKKMEMDMAKNNDDTETPSMEMMKAMMMPKKEMMKKDEMAKNMEMMKRVNSMKKANPMYAMKDAGKEMMAAMKKVKQGENKKINAMYGEKYLPTREGSLEAAVLKSVSTKKTD